MKDIFSHKARLGLDTIFDEAQNKNAHQRLMKDLINLYHTDEVNFTIEFLQCFACLLQMDKQSCYENTFEFVVKYFIYHENSLNDESLLLKAFRFIFDHHSCKSPAIRYRSCDFIYKILHGKGEQALIDDDVFFKIANTMLQRLQDKVPTIRAQAVLALQRLQDPHGSKCPIIEAFLFHMEHDPSAIVRANILKNIALTHNTFSAVFGRIYDVKVTVRKEAILAISRVKVQTLTIEWRQKILNMSKNAKEDIIKFNVSSLISKWFKQCNEDFLELLKIIFVETLDEETVQFLLHQLFKLQPCLSLVDLIKTLQTNEKLIPVDKLTPEIAALWLAVVKYFEKLGENDNCVDYISEILPELTRFTKYIKTFSAHFSKGCSEKEYIMIQLINLAATFSLSDEMGREQLRQVFTLLLTDNNVVDIGIVRVIVRHLEAIIPSVEDRAIMLAEIISDIREPLQDMSGTLFHENYSDEISPVVTQPADLNNPDCIGNEKEPSKDPEILIKCLTIVIEFMKGKDVTKIDGTLLSLKDHVIMACFKEGNARVADLAQEALALMCIWNLKLAQDNIVNFCLQITDDSVSTSAVESLFDLLLVHGFDVFKYPFSDRGYDQSGTAGTLNNFANDTSLTTPLMRNIIPNFVLLLHSNVPNMRATVCQGLAKLLLASHINSPLVLANLILIWFSPVTEKEPLVRQPLGVFFSVFSRKRPGSSAIIANAVLPALKGLDEMSEEEMYFDINPLSVAKLLVSLVRHDVETPKEGGSYHYRLAVIICEEMQRNTSNILMSILAKTLLLIVFRPEDRILAPSLLTIVKKSIKIMKRYWEKRTLKIMESFKVKIENLIDGSYEKIDCKEEESNNPDTNQEDNVDVIEANKHEVYYRMETVEEKFPEFRSPNRKKIRLSLSALSIAEVGINQPTGSNVSNRGASPAHENNKISTFPTSPSESSDSSCSSDGGGPKKSGVISETSASSTEDEDDLPVTTAGPSKPRGMLDNIANLRASERKMKLSPLVLRSGKKRKS